MAHVGRNIKNIETPRPLKTQLSRSHSQKNNSNSNTSNNNNNYMVIEELIQLIENVAISLAKGVSNPEPMAVLVQNLRVHGPQLEQISKDTLDRSFVTFRNASQDERLNLMTRLNLLELIELRAKGWEDQTINSYYKTKATNVEPDNGAAMNQSTMLVDHQQSSNLSTSPTLMSGQNIGNQQHQVQLHMQNLNSTQILGPGEIIRNSGRFSKPTKIPGKNYSKDEVVIKNADSGKVMGIKGRRVHLIEELSETIISFQKVNPGAKERLVQITGPGEDKINYAKHLIEDTIRRNASPIRLDPTSNMTSSHGVQSAAGGSCSSLASSASDDGTGGVVPRNLIIPQSNRSSFGATSTSTPILVGKPSFRQQHNSAASMLLHSYSTNDASLGEYKYTVNVGQHLLKITGDCCELVRVAKLVLDDYFSSSEFLASVEAGAAIDGNTLVNSTPTTPLSAGPYMGTGGSGHLSFADSGVSLNYMGGQFANSTGDGDDDVFTDANINTTNGLARSRRSHFSRKDSTPDNAEQRIDAKVEEKVRIVHEYERLIFYAKSPHSWTLPKNWEEICEKHPCIIRNKVTTTTSASTTNTNNNSSTQPQSYMNAITTTANVANNTTPSPNIVRKGFFNRKTNSIDEEGGNMPEEDMGDKGNISNLNNSMQNNHNRAPKLTSDMRSFSTFD